MDPGASEAVEPAVAVAALFFAARMQGEAGTSTEVTVAVAGFVVREARKRLYGLFRRILVAFALAVQCKGVGFQADPQALLRGRDAVRLDGSEGKVALAEASGCFHCLSWLMLCAIILKATSNYPTWISECF